MSSPRRRTSSPGRLLLGLETDTTQLRVPAGFHVAQVNIVIPREPIDSPALAGFVALLEPVDALADAAPGFVWRLQDEGGDATAINAFDDDRILVNMSVWETVEALWNFTYSGEHLTVMRRRREWMIRPKSTYMAPLVDPRRPPPDHRRGRGPRRPATERGPSPEAFTFKQRFPAPAEPVPNPSHH